LLRSLSASFAASLVTAPLVAHHFGEVTPAAPIGNLVLVPVVELVVLPCGLVGALLALLHPWLGALPLMLSGLASRLALALAGIFRGLRPFCWFAIRTGANASCSSPRRRSSAGLGGQEAASAGGGLPQEQVS
jgi:predicted membrane metal-binding protein